MKEQLPSKVLLDIDDPDVAKYVYGQLSPTDPKWVELNEEMQQDPEDSRIGRFCARLNQIVDHAMNIPFGDIFNAGMEARRQAAETLESGESTEDSSVIVSKTKKRRQPKLRHKESLSAKVMLDIDDPDVARYVYGQLDISSSKWLELYEEARRDGDNSRVARYIAKANRTIDEAMGISLEEIVAAGLEARRQAAEILGVDESTKDSSVIVSKTTKRGLPDPGHLND